MLPIKTLLRLARQLERIWASRIEPWVDPWRAWQAVETQLVGASELRRKVQLAASRNLTLTVTELKEESSRNLRFLVGQVVELCEQYEATSKLAPDRCEWVKELRALEDEFGTVEIRWNATAIRAVTEPIVLQDVHLGPFAIEFDWKGDLDSGVRCFRVKALEPNTPNDRDDITHPHVQDDILCAGEAQESLEEAVAAGRIVDAFLIVRSVLETYNGNSAYVPLGEWDGSNCAQCGRRTATSEMYSCEGCGGTVCDECTDRCEGCDQARCGDCLSPCDVCLARHCRGSLHQTENDRDICPNCLQLCSRCGASVPKDEMSEPQLCSTCTSQEESESHDPEVSDTPAEVVAAGAETG